MLIIDNLSFSFGTHLLLDEFSLSLSKAEIGTLIGSSGSGKTTLFRLLTGLLTPQSGSLTIADHLTPQAHHHVAYMTQDDLLLPWRTVIENLMLVAELGKKSTSTKSIREEAYYYLKEVGLEGWEKSYPEQLSGGMRQRASLARVLLQKRPVLLLDEPFAALDISLREHMHTLLHAIRQRHGTTILLVTHDFRDALSLSDRVFLLSQGKVRKEWNFSSEDRHQPVLFHTIHHEMQDAIREDHLRACSKSSDRRF